MAINPASSSGTDLPTSLSGSVADPTIERVARGAHQAVDRVAGTASAAAGRVRSGIQDTRDTVNERMQDLSATRDAWAENARDRVRQRPLATVGVALAAGYLLARLLR